MILDLKLNAPTKKSQLTKPNMLKYIKENGTADDKKWFKELCVNNKIKKMNNLTGEAGDGYNISAIREAFAKKFFPELIKDKKVNKKKSFEEELADL